MSSVSLGLLSQVLWRAEVPGLARITCQACTRSYLFSWCRELPGLTLQRKINQIDGALQVEDSGVHYDIIQVRIVRITVMHFLQVAHPVTIFELYACTCCRLVQGFTNHYIGNTRIEWCHDARMKHSASTS